MAQKVPNARAVELLQTNPAMAAQFDASFGEGAAAGILAAPAPAGSGEESEGPGVMGTILDVAAAIPGGVADAIENTGDLLAQGATAIGLPAGVALGSDADNGIIQTLDAEELAARGGDALFGQTGEQDNITGESETVAGNITRGVTAFLTDFIGAGKFFKGAKILQSGTKAATTGRLVTQGAIADFLAFDPQEGRLANLLQDHTSLENPVLDFLAADEGDGEVEGRLKNALEGALIGGAVDATLRAIKLIRSASRAAQEGGEEAGEKVVSEGIEEIEQALNGQLDLPLGDAAQSAAGAGRRGKSTQKAALEEAGSEGAEETPGAADTAARAAEAEGRFLELNRKEFLDRISRPEQDLAAPQRAFNYDKMDSPTSVQETMAEVAEVVSERVNALSKEGTKSLDEIQAEAVAELSGIVDIPAAQILQKLSEQAKSASEMTKILIAGKHVVQSIARDVHQLNAKIRAGKAADGDREQLDKMLLALWDAQANLKVVQREGARATVAGRIRTMDSELIAMAEGNPQALVKQMSWTKRIWAIHNEYWINALLSGPKTHLINTTSNAIKLGFQPLERLVGGALGGDVAAMRESFAMYSGMSRALKDSTRFAWMSLKQGQSFLDPANTKIDVPTHAIQSQRGDALGNTINNIGTMVRLPTRLLQAEDEFFKQMNFRANLYASSVRQGIDNGLSGKELATFIENQFAKGIDDAGRGIDSESIRYAREATFTTELESGSISGGLQRMAIQHPMLRTIAPFIRTPTNILVDVGQRTPGVQMLSKRLRADLAAGGQRAASARGKLAMGTLLWSTGAVMASEGRITGAGPQDPSLRKNLMETGWRPYSFVTTNDEGKKVFSSFARMDPFGMILGLIADTTEIASQADDKEVGEIVKAGMTALAHNITNKSYLQGVSQVMNAMTNPDRFLERFIQQRAGSYVPTGAQQIAGGLGFRDPYLREVNTVMEALQARTPGFSKALFPQRSWVSGEPIPYDSLISPFPQAVQTDDFVVQELATLQHGFGKPSNMIGKTELTPEQYDKYLQLAATPPGRVSLRDALAKVMKSPKYDIEREKRPDLARRAVDAGLASEDPRVQLIQRVVKKYRDRAKKLLTREFPDLQGALRAEKLARKDIKRGQSENVQKWLDSVNE